MAPATDETVRALEELRREVETCSRCVLHETRTRTVFGEGDPGAELMFIGEAPGYHEDQQGRPFVGAAGKLLEELLASIGLSREQVYIANVLKSRPPNNRDPRPEEIDACQPYLWRQIELIRPKVICTLGNFATKLLSGDQTGITRVHGRPRPLQIAGVELYLYPIFHPAAALYTPAMLATLREDFLRLPDLLKHAGATGPGAGSARAPHEPKSNARDEAEPAPADVERAAEAPGPTGVTGPAADAAEPAGNGEPAAEDGETATEARSAPQAVWHPVAQPVPMGDRSQQRPEAEPAEPEQLGLF